MKNWLKQFPYSGCLESDSEPERQKKAILVFIPTAISLLAILWSFAYLYLGRPISAAIPGGYAIVSLLSIFIFFQTKHYTFFRFSQLFFILLLPFFLQWTLGGFNSGSVVIIWAILSPIGALMFHGARQALPWFTAYIALTLISGIFEQPLSTMVAPLSPDIITTFFVLNVSAVTFLICAVVYYFVVDNKRIISALSDEKDKSEKALVDSEKAKNIIEEQANKLIEMDQIRNRFIANITHEFRTPLALTIGPLEDALEERFGTVNPDLQNQLHVMLRNSRRLLRLVNQLLDISKIEATEMKLNKQLTNITLFCEEICQAFTPYLERKNIDFNCEVGKQEIYIELDEEKLEKILNNLLSNAIKFTQNNGHIKLHLEKIKTHENEGIQIAIKDNGPGISNEFLPNIFDRFFQVDGSSTREYEGTGIGLSLVKELVDLHGGNIKVNSELGFGAEFIIFIPGKISNKSDKGFSKKPHTKNNILNIEMAAYENENVHVLQSQNKSKNKHTVLIVDDNQDIRHYLNTCLSSKYIVVQACDGVDGLNKARKHKPEIIITDIMMPKMDGYEFCKTIKQDAELNHIPVIFLTAKSSEEMKLEGLKTGADDYLSKPFSAKELLARTENLITIRQQHKELKKLNQELELKVKDQLDELVKNKRLGSYFSKKMLQQLLRHEDAADLITTRRNITIFFCDLCNFTDLTDRIETEQTTIILNQYLTEMTTLIEQHGATVIQIIGDAIMAFFGAPDEMESDVQAINAVHLGIAMQNKIKTLSDEWLQAGMEYQASSRIGIHQDYVTVGNFGSQHYMEYTAVGRGVNLASRLESTCTPGNIKLSYPVYLLAKDNFTFSVLKEESFKGFARKIKVCEYEVH
jgi:signal transduction histidine kinase/class 3 adenylate cyclase